MKPLEKALTNRQFPQILFQSTHQFGSFLRDRGFRLNTSGINTLVDGGLIERLNTGSGDFHPFQIWPVYRLFRQLEIQFDSAFGVYGWDESGLRKFIDQNLPWRARHLVEFPKSDQCKEFNNKIFPLLLWLESIYLPVSRGPRPSIVHVSGCDAFEWYSWEKQSVVDTLLEDHSLTVEQLTECRRQILFDAFDVDPAQQLYLLLRSMPFEQRDQFRGRLRLAYDLYEMAEIIRMFLGRVVKTI